MRRVIFQTEIIDTAGLIKDVNTEADGALVLFAGMVRNSSNLKKGNVEYIDYELYESMSVKEMNKIIDETYKRWNINSCIVCHRYGRVNLAEASILIAVTSSHRADSYNASQYIIDSIKKRVPIWKTEYFADGTNITSDRN